MADTDMLVGLFFRIKIDSCDLGAFTTCDGLSMDVETEDRIEGGNNGFVHKLPVRIKYANVKFTRPVGPESAKVARWLASMGKNGITRGTAEIEALTPHMKKLVSWKLNGVIPVKWQGPSFSAESPKIAVETLEIAHHGFTFEAA
jgi:phage tail-like protein